MSMRLFSYIYVGRGSVKASVGLHRPTAA